MNTFFNIFPNTIVRASYDTFSQIINLSSYDQAQFIASMGQAPNTEDRIERLSVFRHEVAHWLDHISTLWGHRNLLMLHNALNARATNDLQEFWRIKMHGDATKRDASFEYFTEIYNRIHGSVHDRWKATMTAGLRFRSNGASDQSNPILFIRFNANNDVPIARVPISIASILEVIATRDEFMIKIGSLGIVDDIVEKARLDKKYKEDILRFIYNSNLTLYNAVAHVTANAMTQTDILWTLDTASAIGTIVLNLPDSYYDDVTLLKTGLADVDARAADFMKQREKGFLFYQLTGNLATAKGPRHYSTPELLAASGLPDVTTLETAIVAEMEKNVAALIPGPFYQRGKRLMEAGIDAFKKRGIDGRKAGSTFNTNTLTVKPRIMFGDTFYDDANVDIKACLDKLTQNQALTPEEEYVLFEHYKGRLEEFLNVCGI